ncbi:Serine protease 46 [Lemmus lemmus]
MACESVDPQGLLPHPLSSVRFENLPYVEGPWYWSCGQTNVSCKLVNGKVVEVGRWPWQVSILFLGLYVCSGSLIHHSWILTAAHCLQRSKDPINYTVKVGVQNLPDNSSELLLTNIVIHEKFNNHMSYNIAILKLKYPVAWSPLVQPICLPTINFKPTIGTMCWVIGWGKEKTKGERNRTGVLRHLTLQDTVLGSPPHFFLYSVQSFPEHIHMPKEIHSTRAERQEAWENLAFQS